MAFRFFSRMVRHEYLSASQRAGHTLRSPISKPVHSWVSGQSRLQFPGYKQVARFHACAPKHILPPGPQVIQGTVNEPAPVPKPSPTHGSYHWTFERALSVGLIPLTVAPFAYGSLNPVLDSIFVAITLLHSHIGFTSVIVDYIPNRQHPKMRKFFEWALRAATLLVGIGFYEFETNDVGLTEGIRRIWEAGRTHSHDS